MKNSMPSTLRDLAKSQSNDYSALEKQFTAVTGQALVSYVPYPCTPTETLSVVLPSHNVPISLQRTLMALEQQDYRGFEVIVVDDGSQPSLETAVATVPVTYDLHYIRNQHNRDRSCARNIGITIASGQSILILDPDMVPHSHALGLFAERQKLLHSAVLLGFRDPIDVADYATFDRNILAKTHTPDYRKDWRYERQYNPSITPPNYLGRAETQPRVLRLLDETRNFKDLGKERIFGAWDLPSLILGHTICLKRNYALQIGGFCEHFIGWGHDDIAFGLKAVAGGSFIIPLPACTSFHINHPPHSGTAAQKLTEFRQNRQRYIDMTNTTLSHHVFPKHAIHALPSVGHTHRYEAV